MKKHLLFIVCCFFFCFGSEAQSQFWGMSAGLNTGGSIFITDNTGGNLFEVRQFLQNQGGMPYMTQMCEAPDGKLYGLTSDGGLAGMGVIYQYDPYTNKYKDIHDFMLSLDGINPSGGLVMANNGNLYGTTATGGINDDGVLFEFNLTNGVYTKIIDFDQTTSGGNPFGTLVNAPNGKLYGTTRLGGINGDGVIFEFDPTAGVYVVKHNFNNATDGSNPSNSLMLADNGKLYGMTYSGGNNGAGTIFEYDIYTASFVLRYSFDEINGLSQQGNLFQAANGKFYGLRSRCGINDMGILFEYSLTGDTYTKLIDFGNWGYEPLSSLIQAGNGLLYGVTKGGGANGDGVLFSFSIPDTTLAIVHNFDSYVTGRAPMGSLIQSSNGKLYGTAQVTGGAFGVIYELDYVTGTFTIKIRIGTSLDGYYPDGGLTLASNGKLYGMTTHGGTSVIGNNYDCGVLFEMDPINGVYAKKVDLSNSLGCHPNGTMINATNGKLYGLTQTGGAYDNGVIFEFNPINGDYLILHHFEGDTNGGLPRVRLVQASNGNLYGVTCCSGGGVLFEYNLATHIYSIKVHFDYTLTGINPFGGGLVEATNGKLYGLATYGGINSSGTLFEYDIVSNTCSIKINFDSTSAINPDGSMIRAQNGKLYGVIYTGGLYGDGILFEYDPLSNQYIEKVNFLDSINGARPINRLMEASDGLLYGFTRIGGDFSDGVIFAFDPVSGACTKQLDINLPFDNLGEYPHLIEVASSIGFEELPENNILIYPNPSDGLFSVRLNGNLIHSLEVVNSIGNVVYSWNKPGADYIQLDLRGFSSGLYLLILRSNRKTVNYKLMVQ
jgi:uncharacterized repeat protein (TIGR03803 family)